MRSIKFKFPNLKIVLKFSNNFHDIYVLLHTCYVPRVLIQITVSSILLITDILMRLNYYHLPVLILITVSIILLTTDILMRLNYCSYTSINAISLPFPFRRSNQVVVIELFEEKLIRISQCLSQQRLSVPALRNQANLRALNNLLNNYVAKTNNDVDIKI